MKITVIGCGRWGSFIAWYLDSLSHDVTLYGRSDSRRFAELSQTRRNSFICLPDSIKLSNNFACVKECDTLIISVDSQGLRSLCKELSSICVTGKTVVLCMKGLEISTGARLSQIASEALGKNNEIAVWLGPGHVQEFCAGVPNCMVIDSNSEKVKERLVKEFSGDLIRFYYGTDLIGNEIGAALKNVIGIAAGMLDGMSLTTLKGALMSRGTREVARLISAMGGNELSAYGLCHLGDYEATVFSPYSHNRHFGEAFIKGESYTELAEGYYTAKAVISLAAEYCVDMPICRCVYSILYENLNAKVAIDSLFHRSLKAEF